MTLNRRTFLKVLAASGAAPTVAHAEQRATETDRLVWKRTRCTFCDVGCGLLVGIQNGRAVAVKGDTESPVSNGLACAKGYHAVQALYGKDRLRHALVRRGGRLVPTSLDEAYDIIARTIRETRQKHGKHSVALYGSGHGSITDAYVGGKLFRQGLASQNVDTSTSLYGASAQVGAVSSFGMDGAIGTFGDIEHADVIVLWNHNIAEADPVLFSRILERRRKERVRVIELATRTTRTSYALDRAILYAPQSELAVANAICEQIVARHGENHTFLERHVAFKQGDGSRDLSWQAYKKFLAAYAPRKMQRISGVAPEDITWLASLYADPARKVMSIWGTEINQHANGTWVNNAINNIHLLTGKIGTPGNNPLVMCSQSNGAATVHDAGARGNTPPGALSLFHALDRGEVRFLWIQGTNPMVSLPNLQRHRRAAGRDDAFIVVSEAYPTATTDIADVVLPAALWIEQPAVYASAERRLQYSEQMIAPPGDAATDAWHTIEVARRLGLARLLPWTRATHVQQAWDEYASLHAHPARRVPALRVLRAEPAGVVWPASANGSTQWRFNPKYDPAADSERGAFDFYGHHDHRAWIWLRPYQAPPEAPDERYPFWLTTGHVLEHAGTGTLTRRIPTLHRAVPRAYVELNAVDAEALGIKDGQRVRLTSRRGSLELPARINQRSQPGRGQVFVPSFDEDAPVNVLTLDAACPLSGQPAYHTTAVRLERMG